MAGLVGVMTFHGLEIVCRFRILGPLATFGDRVVVSSCMQFAGWLLRAGAHRSRAVLVRLFFSGRLDRCVNWVYDRYAYPLAHAAYAALASAEGVAMHLVIVPAAQLTKKAATWCCVESMSVYRAIAVPAYTTLHAGLAWSWDTATQLVAWLHTHVLVPGCRGLEGAARWSWGMVFYVYSMLQGCFVRGWETAVASTEWLYQYILVPSWHALCVAASWMMQVATTIALAAKNKTRDGCAAVNHHLLAPICHTLCSGTTWCQGRLAQLADWVRTYIVTPLCHFVWRRVLAPASRVALDVAVWTAKTLLRLLHTSYHMATSNLAFAVLTGHCITQFAANCVRAAGAGDTLLRIGTFGGAVWLLVPATVVMLGRSIRDVNLHGQ